MNSLITAVGHSGVYIFSKPVVACLKVLELVERIKVVVQCILDSKHTVRFALLSPVFVHHLWNIKYRALL
jgi:hypothetical protein